MMVGNRARRWIALWGLAAGSVLVGPALPAHALAWGPYESSYEGEPRVLGYGEMTWKYDGSLQSVRAVDRADDGNNVYGHGKWRRMGTWCSGVQGTFSTSEFCSGASGPEHKKWSTAESCDLLRHQNGQCAYLPSAFGEEQAGWCDDDGNICVSPEEGLASIGGACAQMGWPIPDNCTRVYVEYHRPSPVTGPSAPCQHPRARLDRSRASLAAASRIDPGWFVPRPPDVCPWVPDER